jgi:hypothetical protein
MKEPKDRKLCFSDGSKEPVTKIRVMADYGTSLNVRQECWRKMLLYPNCRNEFVKSTPSSLNFQGRRQRLALVQQRMSVDIRTKGGRPVGIAPTKNNSHRCKFRSHDEAVQTLQDPKF